MKTESEVINELVSRLNAVRFRDGRYIANCPFCGKPAIRGQVHFSFWGSDFRSGEAGYKCFVCDAGGGLRSLAWNVLKNDHEIEFTPRQQVEPKQPDWIKNIESVHKSYLTEDRFDAWMNYKPVTKDQILEYSLGVGKFLQYTSFCQHQRLMVPIYDFDNKLVGFRGRSTECDCKSWLSPLGSSVFPFNWKILRNVKNKPLFVIENPADCLLLKTYKGIDAIGVFGVTNWWDELTVMIQNAKPKVIVVAFDNDRPGNGGGEEGKRLWLEKHEKDLIPNGVKLVNNLLESSLPAVLFDWGKQPHKADIGSYIMQMMVK